MADFHVDVRTVMAVLAAIGATWVTLSPVTSRLILRLLCRDAVKFGDVMLSVLASKKHRANFKELIEELYEEDWHPEQGAMGERFFGMLASQRFAPRVRALIDGMYGPTLAERRKQFEEMAVQIDDVRELCEETQQLLSGLQSTGLSTERRLEALEKLTRDVPSLTGALQQLNATLSEVSREMKAMSKTVDRLEYRAEEDEKRKGVVPDSGARRRRTDP